MNGTRDSSGSTADGQPLAEGMRSPLIGYFAALKNGKSVEEATRIGIDRAKRQVGMNYDAAHRTALMETISSSDLFDGWTRAVRGTCGACAAKAGGHTDGLLFQAHPGCQCVAEPSVEPAPPVQALAQRRFGEEAGFTADEVRAVGKYTGSIDSFLINKAIRDGLPMGGRNQQIVDGIEAALDRAGPIGVPTRVYRGIVGDPDELLGGPGSVVEDLGFGSTTGTREWVSEFIGQRPGFLGGGDEILMTLDVDPRVRAIWGANEAEAELLLERGCRYVIERVEKKGGKWHVRAKVLPPE